MPLLQYHSGQVEIQDEANTRTVADRLTHWTGPVAEFAVGADLFLLATRGPDGDLRIHTLSGPGPLVEVIGPARLRLLFPSDISDLAEGHCGGLAINLGQARRARVNGELIRGSQGYELNADEAFTLCRKYMAPSIDVSEKRHVGPWQREPVDLREPWITDVIARAETSFLASVSPDGRPDIAHRGGPAGFIRLDTGSRRISWPEFLGDGIFKSAGNMRATGAFALVVPDLLTGGAVELVGRGDYANVLVKRRERQAPLVQHKDPHPVQGNIEGTVEHVFRLAGFINPRRRITKAVKITSQSSVEEQMPQ